MRSYHNPRHRPWNNDLRFFRFDCSESSKLWIESIARIRLLLLFSFSAEFCPAFLENGQLVVLAFGLSRMFWNTAFDCTRVWNVFWCLLDFKFNTDTWLFIDGQLIASVSLGFRKEITSAFSL
jgi:hypothetical protein